jgi:hypothetical protein
MPESRDFGAIMSIVTHHYSKSLDPGLRRDDGVTNGSLINNTLYYYIGYNNGYET